MSAKYRSAVRQIGLAGAMVAASTLGSFSASAQNAKFAAVQQGCGLMTPAQKSKAMRLLLSISDDYPVTGEYLRQAGNCIKGVEGAKRPELKTAIDRKAHGEFVGMLAALGIPAI
jgi:hypothetical protein